MNYNDFVRRDSFSWQSNKPEHFWSINSPWPNVLHNFNSSVHRSSFINEKKFDLRGIQHQNDCSSSSSSSSRNDVDNYYDSSRRSPPQTIQRDKYRKISPVTLVQRYRPDSPSLPFQVDEYCPSSSQDNSYSTNSTNVSHIDQNTSPLSTVMFMDNSKTSSTIQADSYNNFDHSSSSIVSQLDNHHASTSNLSFMNSPWSPVLYVDNSTNSSSHMDNYSNYSQSSTAFQVDNNNYPMYYPGKFDDSSHTNESFKAANEDDYSIKIKRSSLVQEFSCKKCRKEFTTSGALGTHMLVHGKKNGQSKTTRRRMCLSHPNFRETLR